MSYVSESRRGNPVGMGAAIFVNGSIILAVALSPIVAEYVPDRTIIIGRNIEDRPPPQPDRPDEKQQAKRRSRFSRLIGRSTPKPQSILA